MTKKILLLVLNFIFSLPTSIFATMLMACSEINIFLNQPVTVSDYPIIPIYSGGDLSCLIQSSIHCNGHRHFKGASMGQILAPFTMETKIVRESDYSPAAALFLLLKSQVLKVQRGNEF